MKGLRRARRRRTITWVAVALVVLFTLAGALYLWALLGPLPGAPEDRLVASPTVYLDRSGLLLYTAPAAQQQLRLWVGLDQVSAVARAATVATEDARFYSRPVGLDPISMARAAWQSLRGGSSGASTIDEQLARTLYLPPAKRGDRSFSRKLQEWVWALRLGHQLSHDRVLELYLNAVDYGNQSTGIGAAAQTYFGKPARDLDLAQAALLAGLPQSPTRYDPLAHPEAAVARRAQVLELMRRHGAITEAQLEAAAAEPLALAPRQHPLLAPHFVAMVQDELTARLGPERVAAGGLVVRMTLDLGLQRAAEETVAHGLAGLQDHNVSDAAVVALDPRSGEILALVGSADYFDVAHGGNVNVATALRQPGSAIKPVVYAAALGSGMTPATELDDVHQDFDGEAGAYTPSDYDNTFHGPVPLRVALASSLNVPAVEVLERTGRDAVLQVAARLGLGGLASSSAGLSLALGGGEVRLLDLTAAYAAFDDGGLWHHPDGIGRVEDGRGRVVLRGDQSAQQAVSPQVAYLLTDILSDDDARALGFGYGSPLVLDSPAAVKTGTTSDFRDNWTVGYSPDLVVGVWTGNADGSPMRDVSGVSGAAPIWHELMERALAGTRATPFRRPEGIVTAVVCSPTGLLPGPDCPHQTSELFAAGTEPTETETYYRSLDVCPDTGAVFGPDCSTPAVSRVFPFPKPELVPWMREAGVELPPVPPYADAAPLGPAPAPGPAGVAAVRIAINSPDAGGTYHISRELPLAQQALPFAVTVDFPDVASVRLFVDGVLLEESNSLPYRTLWPLESGQHAFTAEALGRDGETLASRSVQITVLP